MARSSLRKIPDTAEQAIENHGLDAPSTAPDPPGTDSKNVPPLKSNDPAIAVVRTTVNLHPDAVAALREMANDRATTVAEVIRRAIWMEKYVHDTLRDGGKILVQEADRTLKELVIR